MMGSEKQNAVKEVCLKDGCTDGYGPWCKECGWNVNETERRKDIPLVLDRDGLYRKHI